MSTQPRNLPHLYLYGSGANQRYVGRAGGKAEPTPQRDRDAHARSLLGELNRALGHLENASLSVNAEHVGASKGFYLEFTLPPSAIGFVDKLENRTKKIE